MTNTNNAIIESLLKLDEYKKILEDIKTENEKFIKTYSSKIDTLENFVKEINEKLLFLDRRVNSLEKISEKLDELEKNLNDLQDVVKTFDETLKEIKEITEEIKKEKDMVEIKYAALIERLKSLI